MMHTPYRQQTVARLGQPDDGTPDMVAVEEPLEIRLADVPLLVTMRTPGHDAELAVGALFTEGVVESPDDILGAEHIDTGDASNGNVITVTVAEHARIDPTPVRRCTYVGSSCGVCGKSAIEQIRMDASSVSDGFAITHDVLNTLVASMRGEQSVFEQTGGVHAAALFDAAGRLHCLREDVGRHNAVDKVVGRAVLDHQLPLDERLLVVSGRISFEIVQKALRASIPMIAAVSAPTSLAVDLAAESNMTLAGFLRNGRVTVYVGAQRVVEPR